MKRFLKINEEFIKNNSEVAFFVEKDLYKDWSTELMLLIYKLSDSLTILTPKGGKIRIKVDFSDCRASKCIVEKKNTSYDFTLFINQIEYFCHFILKAYSDSDQSADVDHIHIEGDLLDFTPMFTCTKTPLTPEEAEKLMGDD